MAATSQRISSIRARDYFSSPRGNSEERSGGGGETFPYSRVLENSAPRLVYNSGSAEGGGGRGISIAMLYWDRGRFLSAGRVLLFVATPPRAQRRVGSFSRIAWVSAGRGASARLKGIVPLGVGVPLERNAAMC